MSVIKTLKTKTKRGDTFIEVMFALAVFSLVAVLSIAMMNSGIATSERSLEIVTARNELNAQAEALRFIHGAYTDELSLPECSSVSAGQKCQKYAALWNTIIAGAKNPYDPNDSNNDSNYSIPSPLTSCQDVYDNDDALLKDNNAFIINTRAINSDTPLSAYVPVTQRAVGSNNSLFQPALLNARIVFTNQTGKYDEDDGDSSADVLSTNPTEYRNVGQVDGIWVVAVKDEQARYYDFYIQTCWYGSGMRAPTSLDTIVRLYNPENLKSTGGGA